MPNFAPGQLAIINQPRARLHGFAVRITALAPQQQAVVELLDSDEPTSRLFELKNLLPTGRTPEWICARFDLQPSEFQKALGLERALPEFSSFRKARRSRRTAKPKTLEDQLKGLNKQQRELLVKMLHNIKENS